MDARMMVMTTILMTMMKMAVVVLMAGLEDRPEVGAERSF